jgi:ubiquitin
LIFAGK